MPDSKPTHSNAAAVRQRGSLAVHSRVPPLLAALVRIGELPIDMDPNALYRIL
jgi:hypothetical protein